MAWHPQGVAPKRRVCTLSVVRGLWDGLTGVVWYVSRSSLPSWKDFAFLSLDFTQTHVISSNCSTRNGQRRVDARKYRQECRFVARLRVFSLYLVQILPTGLVTEPRYDARRATLPEGRQGSDTGQTSTHFRRILCEHHRCVDTATSKTHKQRVEVGLLIERFRAGLDVPGQADDISDHYYCLCRFRKDHTDRGIDLTAEMIFDGTRR